MRLRGMGAHRQDRIGLAIIAAIAFLVPLFGSAFFLSSIMIPFLIFALAAIGLIAFVGVVFMQRLLREPPSMELRHCVARNVPTVAPETADRAVFEEFASYDMLSLAVVDEGGRLLGAVSVDDVVDRMLGAGWRLRHRRQDGAAEQVVAAP